MYSTLLASCSQNGWTSNSSSPGSSSEGSKRPLVLSHALPGGNNRVQQLLLKLRRIASRAMGTGTSPATAAMPQSEASDARMVPKVFARRLTTARVETTIMVRSSSFKAPDSRTTCESPLEAAIASNTRFITDSNLLRSVSTEINDPASDLSSPTVLRPRLQTLMVMSRRGQRRDSFPRTRPFLPSTETPQKEEQVALSKAFLGFVGRPTSSYLAIIASMRSSSSDSPEYFSPLNSELSTFWKQTKSSMTTPTERSPLGQGRCIMRTSPATAPPQAKISRRWEP